MCYCASSIWVVFLDPSLFLNDRFYLKCNNDSYVIARIIPIYWNYARKPKNFHIFAPLILYYFIKPNQSAVIRKNNNILSIYQSKENWISIFKSHTSSCNFNICLLRTLLQNLFKFIFFNLHVRGHRRRHFGFLQLIIIR